MPLIKRPSVRLLKLAKKLKQLREQAGYSQKEVSESTGISEPVISRIENAQVTVSAHNVQTLLELYGAPGQDRDALITLARESAHRGWWQQYGDLYGAGYLGLEDETDEIFAFENGLVPGLLQTPDYHRALLLATSTGPIEPHTLERHVRARAARQALITRPKAPALHFVLGEAVIRQMVGGRDVMHSQVLALWESSNRPNITLQIVPFSAGAHAGLEGPFTILSFKDYDMRIACTEGPGGHIYLEGNLALESINVKRESVLKEALSPHDSADLLREVADSVKE